jgi:hypothetical protein
MSRMVAGLGLLLISGFSSPADAEMSAEVAMAHYNKMTATVTNCRRGATGEEIVVCGRREADHYRLPLVEHDAGDPRTQDVYGERERWQHKTTPCQDHGPFLVGCGMVGLGFSTRMDGGGVTYRPLAP